MLQISFFSPDLCVTNKPSQTQQNWLDGFQTTTLIYIHRKLSSQLKKSKWFPSRHVFKKWIVLSTWSLPLINVAKARLKQPKIINLFDFQLLLLRGEQWTLQHIDAQRRQKKSLMYSIPLKCIHVVCCTFFGKSIGFSAYP